MHTVYMVFEIQEYILPLTGEMWKALYLYQSVETLISCDFNWFNNLQLLIPVV